ncbi:MAG: tryptophan synthase subunit alpha, partial [Acidobacteria bacterium]
MSAIADAFARCRAERRAAFIPFLMAGDPTLDATGKLMHALVRGGADLIELGVPFSDPIADGPANQAAAGRALAAGTNLSGVLRLIAQERDRLGVPVVLFTYFNPIHARGVDTFAEQAAASGVDGVLCVDLPPDESDLGFVQALRSHGLDAIQLLAPTSTRERIKKVAQAASGFIYYVSRTGVTGSTDPLPKPLLKEVKRLRRKLTLPLAVGFGIATPEQVKALARVADGVVVGSELVRIVEAHGGDHDLPNLIEARARELAAGV